MLSKYISWRKWRSVSILKLPLQRDIIVLENRHDYEFDLVIGYIGANLLYEETGWGLHFPTIIKKGRKTINITIITAQFSDNKVTVSNQQDPWCSVYFSVLLKNRLYVIPINYLNLFFVGKKSS